MSFHHYLLITHTCILSPTIYYLHFLNKPLKYVRVTIYPDIN